MSNFYESSLEKIENFFFLEKTESAESIFLTLKTIINFESAYVFYLSPQSIRLEYSYNSQLAQKECEITHALKENLFSEDKINITRIKKLLKINDFIIAEKLKIKNNTYGLLILTQDKDWTIPEKKVFKTCSAITASLIKDIELSKIMKMQAQALQEGIAETDKAYKIIKAQNKKIIASDKVKNSFLANVSHELRTPLNSIIGFSELLQNKAFGSLTEKQKEYVNDIQISGIHLLGMINEILDISKLEAHSMRLNVQEFSLSQNIIEVLNILKPLYIKKNLTIVEDLSEISYIADYQKIQQILFNLINNAIKYTPENGTITIKTQKTRKKLLISIKDTGCGIAPEFHKKIFKKFEQINQCANSTGLGLTITKELVKMNSGTIKVISNENKGAEFIIKIPC